MANAESITTQKENKADLTDTSKQTGESAKTSFINELYTPTANGKLHNLHSPADAQDTSKHFLGSLEITDTNHQDKAHTNDKLVAQQFQPGIDLETAREQIFTKDVIKQYSLPANSTREDVSRAIWDNFYAGTDARIKAANGGKLPPREQLQEARNKVFQQDAINQYCLPAKSTREDVSKAIWDNFYAGTDARIKAANGGVLPPRRNEKLGPFVNVSKDNLVAHSEESEDASLKFLGIYSHKQDIDETFARKTKTEIIGWLQQKTELSQ